MIRGTDEIRCAIDKLCAIVSMHHSELCELLIEVRDRQLYLQYGFDTLADYFGSLPIEQATLYRLVESYDSLRERGLSRSASIAAFATNGLGRVTDALAITNGADELELTLNGRGRTDLSDRKAVLREKGARRKELRVMFESVEQYNVVADAYSVFSAKYGGSIARFWECISADYLSGTHEMPIEIFMQRGDDSEAVM